ncbi:uncharacterized protein LOC112348287 [Selaginella moellendorffii]|uniref:uncharacterized protein LOC112348287 n=1 Tax=Selaginella moellendorffii TaxID=88036 RepID=UPI000D1CB788|nr:uncharacterized protein LOC112348287 [Selaginella moellendorffii]|eukprot:XP_024536286.1 uncharacterized protein LOC112348287 [Selaginella moellendorffii]
MGAGQRGLAEILPCDSEAKESSESGAVSRFLCAAAATSAIASPEEDQGKQGDLDEAGVLREQFESQARQLIARINWLQENLQLEEESRLVAENQALSLRLACAQQAGKVEELSEQISMLFQDLDEQHKHWTSLEAKLEFEQQERLHIEATLKALAAGAAQGFCSSPPPQSCASDGWSSAQASPTPTAAVEGFRVSWDNVEYEGDAKKSSCKAANMFKELNSEWSNYKSEGKLGSWSLAKVLRRLSFSDVKKKRGGANKSSSSAAFESAPEANSGESRRVYDTAKLTEEIFSLNSEASDVRERHLADLRNKLELQHRGGRVPQVEDRDVSSETWSDYPKPRFKSAKVSRSVSRSTTKRHGSQKSFELDNKAHFKIENLGRQVFHLKKLCTEKTQLVKLEKRRRNEAENRYYVLVKNLEKQVLQLRKINLRKADEIKQERCRRQEAEKRSVVEVESLERQVVRLSKLADARAHDVKHEQKQRLEAQKRLKDLVSQLKSSKVSAQGVQLSKPQRSPKAKQAASKTSLPLSPAGAGFAQAEDQPADDEVGGREDEGEFVELEALQFRTLGTSDFQGSSSERHVWKLQTKQKGRIVLTPLQSVVPEHKCKSEQQQQGLELSSTADRERDEVQVEEAGPNSNCNADSGGTNQILSDNESSDSLSVATPQQGREDKRLETSVTASPRPSSLTGKISQLKETTTRLLKDLEGTQLLLNTPATTAAIATIESEGPGFGLQESLYYDDDFRLKHHLLELRRGFRARTGLVGGIEDFAPARSDDHARKKKHSYNKTRVVSKGWMKTKVELMLRLVFDRQEQEEEDDDEGNDYRVLVGSRAGDGGGDDFARSHLLGQQRCEEDEAAFF